MKARAAPRQRPMEETPGAQRALAPAAAGDVARVQKLLRAGEHPPPYAEALAALRLLHFDYTGAQPAAHVVGACVATVLFAGTEEARGVQSAARNVVFARAEEPWTQLGATLYRRDRVAVRVEEEPSATQLVLRFGRDLVLTYTYRSPAAATTHAASVRAALDAGETPSALAPG